MVRAKSIDFFLCLTSIFIFASYCNASHRYDNCDEDFGVKGDCVSIPNPDYISTCCDYEVRRCFRAKCCNRTSYNNESYPESTWRLLTCDSDSDCPCGKCYYYEFRDVYNPEKRGYCFLPKESEPGWYTEATKSYDNCQPCSSDDDCYDEWNSRCYGFGYWFSGFCYNLDEGV